MPSGGVGITATRIQCLRDAHVERADVTGVGAADDGVTGVGHPGDFGRYRAVGEPRRRPSRESPGSVGQYVHGAEPPVGRRRS